MEALAYHNTARNSKFAVLQLLDSLDEQQRKSIQLLHPVQQLHQVLIPLLNSQDVYISAAEYFGNRRRTCNFAQTKLAFVDFDTHKVTLGAHAPEEQAEILIGYCEANEIPRPSLIVYSGRGLHAKWVFSRYIPSQALPRWQALEKALIGRFPLGFGADRSVCDITRVLRLTGTVNSKTGELCRLIYGDWANPQMYDFDRLCDALLPFTRQELATLQEERLQQRVQKGLQQPTAQQIRQGNLILHSIKELWWLRYLDLQQLAKIRASKGELEGHRQQILFWSLNALAQSSTVARPLQYWNEANTIAQNLGNYRYNDMQGLYRRCKAYMAGERYEYNGQAVTPLYRVKTQTLIDYLEIKPEEIAQMRVIIDSGTKKERRKAAQKNAYELKPEQKRAYQRGYRRKTYKAKKDIAQNLEQFWEEHNG